MIALIDYGAGNLRSIENALAKVGGEAVRVTKPAELEKASAIILPGVGSFGAAMKKLEKFREPLAQAVGDGTPFLGLCLGIQVILSESEESPGVEGLGLLEGSCKRFAGDLKVPHMGWNEVKIKGKGCPLLSGVANNSFFYFVHSYIPVPKDGGVVAASTKYGVEFASVLCKDNLYATQFHPERSGEAGLQVLKNFVELI